MAAAHQRKIRELFDAARDLPLEDRMGWLAAQRQEPPEVLEAVAKLLRAASSSGDFLANPAIKRQEPVERKGRRIGPYKVVRELGTGGMGVVYECVRDDDVYQRTVAVKIIRADRSAPQMLARFNAERQILARLDHPSIARIVDGGTTDDNLPYLVMDYIEGEPIDAFCNTRKATLTQRINLIRQVCIAVEYLQRNRVLHRDLKPANILVTKDGLVKLLDFGIAKQMSTEMEAAATTLPLMTPEFASPEQIQSKPLGPASDAYSVASVLYLVLTGRHPFDLKGKPLQDVVRIVSTETPMTMSGVMVSDRPADDSFAVPGTMAEWRSAFKGDLDRIMALALRTEFERRYADASALADDLRRFQLSQPVLARGNPPTYVAMKFLRRNRLLAVATLIVLVSLSVAGVAVDKAIDAYKQLQAVRKIVQAEQAARNVLSQMKTQDPALQTNYVKSQVKQIESNYTDKIAPMLQSPLAPRHAIAGAATDSVSYLNEMAPTAVQSPDTAKSVADAYLAISKLQWSHDAPSLHDLAAAHATALAALQELQPVLDSPSKLEPLIGTLEQVRRQFTDTAEAVRSKR